MDEDIAGSRWWDTRTKRFLRAGVVGTILQTTIRKEYCQSSSVYLQKYSALYSDTEKERLKQRLLKNASIHLVLTYWTTIIIVPTSYKSVVNLTSSFIAADDALYSLIGSS